jgi:hypothetical protein
MDHASDGCATGQMRSSCWKIQPDLTVVQVPCLPDGQSEAFVSSLYGPARVSRNAISAGLVRPLAVSKTDRDRCGHHTRFVPREEACHAGPCASAARTQLNKEARSWRVRSTRLLLLDPFMKLPILQS